MINYVNNPPSNPLMKLRTDMSDTHSTTGFVLYHKNRTLESYSSLLCLSCLSCLSSVVLVFVAQQINISMKLINALYT